MIESRGTYCFMKDRTVGKVEYRAQAIATVGREIVSNCATFLLRVKQKTHKAR